MFTKIKHFSTKVGHIAEQFSDVRVVGVLLLLVIVLLITWSSVSVIETNYKLQKQVIDIKKQNELQQLANDNLRLQNQYFETPQYLDIAARQHFGLAGSGENVLIVPESAALRQTVDVPDNKPADVDGTKAKQPEYQRNFQAWMDFFLHREHTGADQR